MKRFTKILTLLFLILYSIELDAQLKGMNGIYLDLLAPLTGNFTIGYERIGSNSAGSIGFGIVGITEPVFDQSVVSREAQGFFCKIMAKFKSIEIGEKGITNSLEGIYIFPQVTFSNITGNGEFYEQSLNVPRVNVTSWSITLGLGLREFIGKSRRFYFDTYLSLLGYGGSNYAYSDYNFSHWVSCHEEVSAGCTPFMGCYSGSKESKSGYAITAGVMLVWLPANNK